MAITPTGSRGSTPAAPSHPTTTTQAGISSAQWGSSRIDAYEADEVIVSAQPASPVMRVIIRAINAIESFFSGIFNWITGLFKSNSTNS